MGCQRSRTLTGLGRILIADDEETFLHSTADLFRREGYECDCAPDADIAAEKLRGGHYDLLIADIKMPGNSDLELIRDLPRAAKGMPVILVTGCPSMQSAIQSIQLPVMAYMVKPVDFEDLLMKTQAAIDRFRTYRAVCITRERLQNWRQDLESIERWTSLTPRDPPSGTIDAFLTLTLRNIVGCLADLKHLTEALSAHRTEQDACQILNCPRAAAITEALAETVEVLEKTKRAFKSKDVAKVRRKLQALVKSGRQ